MKVDYFKLIEESIKYTWKYKFLWIYGFFIAFFASSGNSGSNNPDFSSIGNNNSSSYAGSSDLENTFPGAEKAIADIQNWFESFVQTPTFWVVLAIVVIVLIALLVLSIYLTQISTNAINLAAKYEKEEQADKMNFKFLWNESNLLFWKVFSFDLFWGLMFFFGLMALIIPIFLMAVFPVLLCLLIIYIPFMLVLIYAIASILHIGRMKVLFEGYNIFDAFKVALAFFKKNLKDWFVAGLAMIIPGIVFGLISLIITIILILVTLGIPVFLMFTNTFAVWTIVLLVVGAFILSVLASILQAPYVVFDFTFWVKLYLLLNVPEVEGNTE